MTKHPAGLLLMLTLSGACHQGATLRIAAPSGAVRSVALADHQPSSLVAILDPSAMQQLGYSGIWHGMSGAPLIVDGRKAGYLVSTLDIGQSPTHAFGYAPSAEVDGWARLVQMLCEPLVDAANEPAHLPNAQLGDFGGVIATTAFVWGDIVYGPSGTICCRDGNFIWMYAHPVLGNGWPARTNLAVVRARPVAVTCFAQELGLDVRLESCDEIGCVRWSGSHGMLAQLGRRCPHLQVEVRGSVRWWRGEGEFSRLHLFAAKQERDFVASAVHPVLASIRMRMADPDAATHMSVVETNRSGANQLRDVRCHDLEAQLSDALSGDDVVRWEVTIESSPSGAMSRMPVSPDELAAATVRIPGRRIGGREVKALEPNQALLAVTFGDQTTAAAAAKMVGCVVEDGADAYLIESWLGNQDGPPEVGVFAGRRCAGDSKRACGATTSSHGLCVGSGPDRTRSARLLWCHGTTAVAILHQPPWNVARVVRVGDTAWLPERDDVDDLRATQFDALAPVPVARRYGDVVAVDEPYVVIELPPDPEARGR